MKSIIEQAFALAEAVDRFREQARRYYYQVMLSGHVCPQCGGGLQMTHESRCRCSVCGSGLDPTVSGPGVGVKGGDYPPLHHDGE